MTTLTALTAAVATVGDALVVRESDRRTFVVKVSAVVVPQERRATVREAVVAVLVESISARGLKTPIRLRSDGRLVCGLHRLVAHERLELDEIEAVFADDEADDVDVELDEIEENLCRRDLTVLERARDEQRRKALYETKFPDTKQGVAGAAVRHGLQAKAISFAGSEATKGSGKRMVEQRVQIAEKLGEHAAGLLGHEVANDHTALLSIARLPDGVRARAVELLVSGAAKTAKTAVAVVAGVEPRAPRPMPEAVATWAVADTGIDYKIGSPHAIVGACGVTGIA
jgi:ParB family chromosome partitioning protein